MIFGSNKEINRLISKRMSNTYFMKQMSSGQGIEFPIQGSHVQNHWVTPR